MAKECDGKWINSKINGVDDGDLDLKEGTGGEITGKHLKSNKSILGQCTGGAQPHITFARIGADGCVYVYHGDMEIEPLPQPHFKIPPGKGKVFKICPPIVDAAKRKVREEVTPDDWVAEHEVT